MARPFLKKLVHVDLLKLARSEESDLTWRSTNTLPRRVLSFAVNASIFTLPAFQNLQLWGKKMSVNCKLCGNPQTALRERPRCNTMLEQGR